MKAGAGSVRVHDGNGPLHRGTSRVVYRGDFLHAGEVTACAVKRLKLGEVYEDFYFDSDLRVDAKAAEILDRWNATKIVEEKLTLNRVEVWTLPDGEKALVEPWLDCLETFRSAKGWATDDTFWSLGMQALGHFSYHASGGELVMCGQHGGSRRGQSGIHLTDPTMMSNVPHTYGRRDLGPEGIRTFFATHTCNQFCRSHWAKPGAAAPRGDAMHHARRRNVSGNGTGTTLRNGRQALAALSPALPRSDEPTTPPQNESARSTAIPIPSATKPARRRTGQHLLPVTNPFKADQRFRPYCGRGVGERRRHRNSSPISACSPFSRSRSSPADLWMQFGPLELDKCTMPASAVASATSSSA